MNINRLLPQRIGFSSAVQRLRRSAPSWQTNVLGLVVVSAIVVAFSVDGYRSAKLNLDDGGVWITSSQRGRAGRVNTQIGQMDGVSPSISPSIDVLQNAKTVLLVDPDSDTVSILDTSTVTKSPSIELPADTSVQMGASVVTILGADGKLWVRSVTDLGAFDKKKTKPTKTAAAGSRVAVGVDGSLALVDPTAQTITPIGGRSGGDYSGAQALKLAGDSLQTAIFGGRVAVLSNDADDATAALQIGDRTIDLSEFGTNGVLGESSDSDRVLVATDTHLISIPADGDADPTVLSDKGTGGAARPVDVATCAYGAWTSTPSEVIACDGATPSRCFPQCQ